MKKILSLIFAALLIAFVMTACAPQDDSQNETNEESNESSVIVLPRDNF